VEIIADDEFDTSPASFEITVAEVVQGAILVCTPDTPLFQVAALMSEAGCSSIIVSEGGETQGIWTEGDALAIDFSSPEMLNQPVGSLMSRSLKAIVGSTTMGEVASRFLSEGLCHYLVVDEPGGDPIGVVSQTDVVLNQGVDHYLHLHNVDSVLKDNALIVEESEILGTVVERMRRHHVDAVLVRYADGECGILTERDVVRFIARRTTTSPVGKLASRPLLTVRHDCTLYRARSLLVGNRVRHIGVSDAEGKLQGVISFTDILLGMESISVQELQRALAERDQALRYSQHNLRLAERVIESSLEGILITDINGVIESVNPAFTRLTGYTREEAIGKTPALLSSGRHDSSFYSDMWSTIKRQGHWQGEIWNRRKNGEVYPERLTIAAIRNESRTLTHYAALFSDISELKENEQRIRSLAYYDPLTNLPNRRLLHDRLSVAIAHAHRNRSRLAVIFADLDRFKRINDSLGHAVGDQLLQEFTARLRNAVREDDTVARMGGDEFVILLTDVDDTEHVAQIAHRIIEQVTQPMVLGGGDMVVTCSLGISFYPDDGSEIDDLLQCADTAMYCAKESGRNNYQFYSPAMSAHSLKHLTMEVALHKALEQDELSVHLQPLLDAESGELVSAEALIRWRSFSLGMVPPSDFIPLAAESSLIDDIGKFVLQRVCELLRRWHTEGRERLSVAVNISARQFHDKRFIETTRQILDGCGVKPGQLCFELSESMLVEDAVENLRTMTALREMGISLAVDDFGTGYSSLNYLRRFPIDKLKIDRAFISQIDSNKQDEALVSAVIKLGHSLGLKVVAEGVERKRQSEVLLQNGCDEIQGFYYSPALEPEQFVERYLPVMEKKSAG
jgi:diguanylate cyclase (GGDEF)-like protein/PAS domain S-box-containing protein